MVIPGHQINKIHSVISLSFLTRVDLTAAMALESEAAFRARSLEIGISSDDLDLLKTGGIKSFSSYAFCCSYQPGSASDDVLFEYLETILGSKPTTFL